MEDEPGQEEPAPVELDGRDDEDVDDGAADAQDEQDDEDDRVEGRPAALQSPDLLISEAEMFVPDEGLVLVVVDLAHRVFGRQEAFLLPGVSLLGKGRRQSGSFKLKCLPPYNSEGVPRLPRCMASFCQLGLVEPLRTTRT